MTELRRALAMTRIVGRELNRLELADEVVFGGQMTARLSGEQRSRWLARMDSAAPRRQDRQASERSLASAPDVSFTGPVTPRAGNGPRVCSELRHRSCIPGRRLAPVRQPRRTVLGQRLGVRTAASPHSAAGGTHPGRCPAIRLHPRGGANQRCLLGAGHGRILVANTGR
jgi:hypothetical protein